MGGWRVHKQCRSSVMLMVIHTNALNPLCPGIRQKLQLHGGRQVNPQASRNTGTLHQPCPQQPAGAITVTKGGCSTRPSPSICQGPTGSHGTGRGAKPFCHSLFSNDNHLIRPLLPRASERLLPQNIIGVHKSKPP